MKKKHREERKEMIHGYVFYFVCSSMQSVRHYLNQEEQRIEVDGKQAGLKCLTEPPSSNQAGPRDGTLEAVVAKANLSDKKVNSDDRFAL